jgi:hypothetical protein
MNEIRHHDKINPNEYRVFYENGVEGTIIAAKYKLAKSKATFWYWRKSILTNRYELVEFTHDGVKHVFHVIDAQVKP